MPGQTPEFIPAHEREDFVDRRSDAEKKFDEFLNKDFFEKFRDKNPLSHEECAALSKAVDDLTDTMKRSSMEGGEGVDIEKNGRSLRVFYTKDADKNLLVGSILIQNRGVPGALEIRFSKKNGAYTFLATEHVPNQDAARLLKNYEKQEDILLSQRDQEEKKVALLKDRYETAMNEAEAGKKNNYGSAPEHLMQMAIEAKTALEDAELNVVNLQKKIDSLRKNIEDIRPNATLSVDRAHASFDISKDRQNDVPLIKSYNGGVIGLFKESSATAVQEIEKMHAKSQQNLVNKFAEPKWDPKEKSDPKKLEEERTRKAEEIKKKKGGEPPIVARG